MRSDPNLAPGTSLLEFKTLVREQFYLLLIDQEAALEAVPKMLPDDLETRRLALDAVKRVLTAFGPFHGEDHEHWARVTQLFNLADAAASLEKVVPLSPARPELQTKAS